MFMSRARFFLFATVVCCTIGAYAQEFAPAYATQEPMAQAVAQASSSSKKTDSRKRPSASGLTGSAPEHEVYNTSGGPVKFAFKYKTGDSYRILSTVNEDVLVNMRLDHRATIINRVSAKITGTDGKGGATHDAIFMTTEDSTGAHTGARFTYGDEYKSIFHRDASGVYTIGDEYFMPTVRDVPTFPDHAVRPGDTWTASGHEAHDLRRGFNLQKPYRVPFTATYTYLGTVSRIKKSVSQLSYGAASVSGKKNNQASTSESSVLHVFNVKYSLYFESPISDDMVADYPATTMGFSDETIYWDAEKGAIDHYVERFRIMIETAYGNMYEFRGTAHAEVTDFVRTGTKENINAIQKQVDNLGIQNVTVKQGEKGLTLSMEDIKFKADSAVLLESEQEKLRQLAQIISAYPDNDILVSGHTALAGTEQERQRLSEERAEAVADFLISLGVKDRYHIFTQGFGASKPLAPNNTESGKAKNRRVEITIMDE